MKLFNWIYWRVVRRLATRKALKREQQLTNNVIALLDENQKIINTLVIGNSNQTLLNYQINRILTSVVIAQGGEITLSPAIVYLGNNHQSGCLVEPLEDGSLKLTLASSESEQENESKVK